MNLILVHPNIQNDEQIYTSLDKSGNLLYNTNNTTTVEDILDKLNEESIDILENVVLLYHYKGNPFIPFLYDPIIQTEQTSNGEEITSTEQSYVPKKHFVTDSMLTLLETLKSTKNISNMDILTCDLNNNGFKEEMSTIETEYNITINYSFNSTGNSVDWILESNGENVKYKYFNSEIDNWSGLLSENISLPTYGNDTQYISVSYINGSDDTSGTKYTLLQDCSIVDIMSGYNSSSLKYFYLQDNDIFDGSGFVINYNGYDTEGIFSCDPLSYSTVPTIKNLGVTNGTISINGGGIVKRAIFNLNVQNCYNQCSSYSYGGGIVGGGAGTFGKATITNCYNLGSIGSRGGGIVGYGAGESGQCIITNCYNNGDIVESCGGIAGGNAGYNGECIITNCYNNGNINNYDAGGIAGANAGKSGICIITNCFNTSSITYSSVGGICGYGCVAIIINCFNKGNISNTGTNAGGIVGKSSGMSGKVTIINNINYGSIDGTDAGGIVGNYCGLGGTCNIYNCFNSGTISSNSGGIAGANAGYNGTCNITNCYNLDVASGQESTPTEYVVSAGTLVSVSGSGSASFLQSSSWEGLTNLNNTTNADLSNSFASKTDVLSGNIIPYLTLQTTEYSYTSGTTTITITSDILTNMSESFRVKWHSNQLVDTTEGIDGIIDGDNVKILPYTLDSSLLGTSYFYAPTPSSDVTYVIAGNDVLLKSDGTAEYDGDSYANGEYFRISGYKINVGSLTVTTDSAGVVSSTICFDGSTKIKTDQGCIEISKINKHKNTIRGKKIIEITKTLNVDKYLISIKKNSLGKNVPNTRTIMSKNHKVFYKGMFVRGEQLIGLKGIKAVENKGDYVYNVLLEEHDVMVANNMKCETLDPTSKVAQLYKYFKQYNLNEHEKNKLVKRFNREFKLFKNKHALA